MRYLTSAALSIVLVSSTAAAPIRVGILNGVGPSRYWHSSTHTASNAIISLLASPAAANLGPRLVISSDAIQGATYGVGADCSNQGCTPSEAQKTAFIQALDSLDVLIFNTNVDIGKVFLESPQRARVERFSREKGIVSLHWSIDSYGSWPNYDSLHAARFNNMPVGPSERSAALRRDSVDGWHAEPSWQFLNRGLEDTTFTEEWMFFTTNANVIRAYAGVRTTINIDESSIAGGLGGARAMGADHPMSWYREFPAGGRFFYTAIGHRGQSFTGNRFIRRQLYNAILWAAKRDTLGNPVGLRGASRVPSPSTLAGAHFSGTSLLVRVEGEGAHRLELLGVDGRKLAVRNGQGTAEHVFEKTSRGGVSILVLTTPQGIRARKIVGP